MNANILSENDVSRILESIGWPKVIDSIAETFIEEAEGRAISPPKVIMQIEEHNNDYRVMPSFLRKYPDYCGAKIVCACPDNPKKYGLPLALGTYVLNYAPTQQTMMIAGANISTAWRTAAASAVAIRALNCNTKPGQTLGIIGCGQQAYFHIPAIAAVTDLKEVLVADINEDNIKKLLAFFAGKTPQIVPSEKKTIFNLSDIVVTMTPTTEPHIFPLDLPNREMVIVAIGGDSDRKIELSPPILKITDHYCDSYEQVSHTGVVGRAMKNGIITRDDLKSVGDFMVGKKTSGNERIRLFLSTGVALEDLAINILLYKNRHLGRVWNEKL